MSIVDLSTLPLSEKQIDFVLDSDAFVNLAEGAIRSGKTASGLLRYLMYIAADAPKTGDLVVCSKTFDTAARNIFNPLRDPQLMGPLAKATTWTRGAPTATILGETVDVVTFNDERAEGRIRGMTCRGGYVDEWSLMPKTFHEQLVGRFSLDGAQLFGNTNPDNPRHWLKEEIDAALPGGKNAADWKVTKFVLDDNPVLSERVKSRYRRQYKGLWYRRMILGEWCLAEGAVYEGWDPARHVVKTLPTITRWIALGVDYGTVNPFAGLVLGLGVDGKLYLCREWRWDSKKQMRQLADVEYSRRLREWLNTVPIPGTHLRGIQPEWIVVDPSAASFIKQLYDDGLSPALADNAVLDGIRLIASLMAEGLLLVHESCEGWIEEAPGYMWDEKAALLGEDKPVKVGDHSLDGGRYAIKTTEALWRPMLRYDPAA